MTTTQEIDAAIRSVDANLTLMKEPWAAATGEKRAGWQRLIDRELDTRGKLTALREQNKKKPVADAALQ